LWSELLLLFWARPIVNPPFIFPMMYVTVSYVLATKTPHSLSLSLDPARSLLLFFSFFRGCAVRVCMFHARARGDYRSKASCSSSFLVIHAAPIRPRFQPPASPSDVPERPARPINEKQKNKTKSAVSL